MDVHICIYLLFSIHTPICIQYTCTTCFPCRESLHLFGVCVGCYSVAPLWLHIPFPSLQLFRKQALTGRTKDGAVFPLTVKFTDFADVASLDDLYSPDLVVDRPAEGERGREGERGPVGVDGRGIPIQAACSSDTPTCVYPILFLQRGRDTGGYQMEFSATAMPGLRWSSPS